jgi:hypothetical protein
MTSEAADAPSSTSLIQVLGPAIVGTVGGALGAVSLPEIESLWRYEMTPTWLILYIAAAATLLAIAVLLTQIALRPDPLGATGWIPWLPLAIFISVLAGFSLLLPFSLQLPTTVREPIRVTVELSETGIAAYRAEASLARPDYSSKCIEHLRKGVPGTAIAGTLQDPEVIIDPPGATCPSVRFRVTDVRGTAEPIDAGNDAVEPSSTTPP